MTANLYNAYPNRVAKGSWFYVLEFQDKCRTSRLSTSFMANAPCIRISILPKRGTAVIGRNLSNCKWEVIYDQRCRYVVLDEMFSGPPAWNRHPRHGKLMIEYEQNGIFLLNFDWLYSNCCFILMVRIFKHLACISNFHPMRHPNASI
jgi:hypothetical protein